MTQCKTVVTPVVVHWSYCNVAQIYWYNYNDRVQVKSFHYEDQGIPLKDWHNRLASHLGTQVM